MKKIIACILCAALLCTALAVFVSAAAKPTKFLVLGDSIAAGSGVMTDRERFAYAWIVADAKGWELTNYGAGGDCSFDLLRKVKEDKNIRQAIREADVINVSIGGNNLLHAEDFYGLIYEGLLGDYSQLEPIHEIIRDDFYNTIPVIRKLNPDALLVVQTLYNPVFPILPQSLYKAYGEAVRGINASIYDYLDENPGAYVVADVYGEFLRRYGTMFFDMTHPSFIGHAVIAQVLLDTIDGTETAQPTLFDAAAGLGISWLLPYIRYVDRVLVAALRVISPVWPAINSLIS